MISKKYLLGTMASILVMTAGAALPAFARGGSDSGDNSRNSVAPGTATSSAVRVYNWGRNNESSDSVQAEGNLVEDRSNSSSSSSSDRERGRQNGMQPAIVGVVTRINGTTLTVATRGFGNRANATTTFTVNAANAVIVKGNATTTLSSVSVNDKVLVQGTVSGTTVNATLIRDNMQKNFEDFGFDRSFAQIKGNGQPIVAGNVTSISGTTLNLNTSSNVAYTVNAASTTISKGGATTTLSSILVGDFVVVQGAVNGTSISASSIIDQSATSTNRNGSNRGRGNGNGNNEDGKGFENSNGNGNGNSNSFGGGFFGGIGNFFRSIFGF
jgi:hypothetical protein